MSKDDIDVGIVFQKEELKELIKTIECADAISNMSVIVHLAKWRGEYQEYHMSEVENLLKKWEAENMGEKLRSHLNVLREVFDNETN